MVKFSQIVARFSSLFTRLTDITNSFPYLYQMDLFNQKREPDEVKGGEDELKQLYSIAFTEWEQSMPTHYHVLWKIILKSMNRYFWKLVGVDLDHHVLVRMCTNYFIMGYILTLFVRAFKTLTFVKGERVYPPPPPPTFCFCNFIWINVTLFWDIYYFI